MCKGCACVFAHVYVCTCVCTCTHVCAHVCAPAWTWIAVACPVPWCRHVFCTVLCWSLWCRLPLWAAYCLLHTKKWASFQMWSMTCRWSNAGEANYACQCILWHKQPSNCHLVWPNLSGTYASCTRASADLAWRLVDLHLLCYPCSTMSQSAHPRELRVVTFPLSPATECAHVWLCTRMCMPVCTSIS